jgi:hypothetical protein
MSSTLAPRERSLMGRAKPCRNGPIAVALPSHCTSLYPILPEIEIGKNQDIGAARDRAERFEFLFSNHGN